jgi:hypothetical protein
MAGFLCEGLAALARFLNSRAGEIGSCALIIVAINAVEGWSAM